MLTRASTGFFATGLLIATACSASAPHPPELSECHDGCSTPIVGAGGTSGGDDASAGCATTANDSQCLQCLGAHCCGLLEACIDSVDCQNLSSCTSACTTAACLSACDGSFPKGVTLLDALAPCETSECPVCSEAGVGDPCSAQEDACTTGLSCAGLWCTKTCLHASDCSGLGAAGGNAFGQVNACMHSATSGAICFPGCTSDSDCSAFPGTYCLSTTSADGLSVTVCANSPDAGTTD